MSSDGTRQDGPVDRAPCILGRAEEHMGALHRRLSFLHAPQLAARDRQVLPSFQDSSLLGCHFIPILTLIHAILTLIHAILTLIHAILTLITPF